MLISFLFLNENICCGYSLEVPWWGASNEYPQHMFSSRNKKNIMWIPPLICSYEEWYKYGMLEQTDCSSWSGSALLATYPISLTQPHVIKRTCSNFRTSMIRNNSVWIFKGINVDHICWDLIIFAKQKMLFFSCCRGGIYVLLTHLVLWINTKKNGYLDIFLI